MTLHTARLTLRPIAHTDTDAMHAIVSLWPVARQLGSWPWLADRDFTQSRTKPFDGMGDIWAITRQSHLIGTIGINDSPQGPGIGYMLHPDHHGGGIMTEAATAAITHAFATYDWPQIQASTWHDNTPSQNLLLKLGFTYTTTNTQPARARNHDTACHHYRLPRTAWHP